MKALLILLLPIFANCQTVRDSTTIQMAERDTFNYLFYITTNADSNFMASDNVADLEIYGDTGMAIIQMIKHQGKTSQKLYDAEERYWRLHDEKNAIIDKYNRLANLYNARLDLDDALMRNICSIIGIKHSFAGRGSK